MHTGTISHSIAVAGVSIQSIITREATGQIAHDLTLADAASGTLTTRTSDTVGIATLEADHGILTGDTVDVYWEAGIRYGVTVGAVSGTTVPLTDSGAGNVLPTASTALTVCLQTVIDTDFDGDLVEMLAILSTTRCHINLQEEDGTSIEARELLANEAWTWCTDTGVTNPIAGDPIGKIAVSNGDADLDASFKVGVLYDSET